MPNNLGPWTPYEPSTDDPWDLRKVAHLHRRAGLGAGWAELHRDLKAGPTASVERLFKPQPMTSDEKQVSDTLRQGVINSGDAERLKAWWLYRLLYDPDPLREKMTLFWHGHFATSMRKVQSLWLMLVQNELFRKHALGSFPDLLSGIVSDGAMLVWLDGGNSPKDKPNENFAREFLELFTVGIGNYSEADIRQAARAFTGWIKQGDEVKRQTESGYIFDAVKFDDGVKKFLGQSGSWKAEDIVRITLDQPAAAQFLCRKLHRFFVSDTDPPEELLRPLADEMRRCNYDMGHMVRVILQSRQFFSKAAYRQRIKSPVEFSAGVVRMLDIPRSSLSLLAMAMACERQGQDLFHPPNVKGWDGGRSWINSTTVLERGNWSSDLIWGNADFSLKAFDPLAWAKEHGVAPDRIAASLGDVLLQGDMSTTARELFDRTGRNAKADDLRKLTQLLLHCSEYQLA